jgi:hypothetical protein
MKKNKGDKTLLPDLILIEGAAGYENVTEFLNAYAHIYSRAKKKSSIYVTADLSMKDDLVKAPAYDFVKGTIFKPLKKDVLKDITSILDPVFN